MSMESGSGIIIRKVKMAVLALMNNTIPKIFGTGDYSNEPDVIRSEPSFGLKLCFLKNEKIRKCIHPGNIGMLNCYLKKGCSTS